MEKVETKEGWLSEKNVIWLFVILYGGGIIAHNHSTLLPFSILITEPLLFMSNGLVMFFVLKNCQSLRFVIWCIVAYLVTFSAEVAGVATGKVFGSYAYGNTLNIKLWEVPVIIGVNWVVLLLASIHISQKYFGKYYWIISPILLTGFDFIMEPTAIRFRYWSWFSNNIPIQNYVAWFTIALIFSIIYKMLDLSIDSRLLRIFFFIQAAFFASLVLLSLIIRP